MIQKYARYTLSIFVLLLCSLIHTTQLVHGPATNSYPLLTFNTTDIINQKTYNPASGTLYVGLTAIPTEAEYTVWAAQRPIGSDIPQFKSIAACIAPIKLLTLATNIGNANPYLAFNYSDDLILHACNYNGTIADTNSTALNDATGEPTGLIAALSGMLLPDSTNKGYIFAAVAPKATDTESSEGIIPFGKADSGIAVSCLNNSSNPGAIAVYQTAANEDLPNSAAAKRLDPSTEQVRIESDPTIDNFATMHWDNQLQRLYVGLMIHTASGTGNGAKALVVGRVQDCGKLDLYNIAPDAVFEDGQMDAIVGAVNDSTTEFNIFMYHVQTMHCSTGPSYLIVNGDVTITPSIHNVIYALPIVDTDIRSEAQGTLAKYDAPLSYKHTFATAATSHADLATNDSRAAKVGAGPLPIQESTPVSDIHVVGDTVYVSIATAQTDTDDGGIFYSQAIFEKTGKIAQWTPWTKKAFPANAFIETSCIDKGVLFFSVDAITGKVWAVDGNTQTVVRVTSWDKGGSCPTRSAQCGTTTQTCCNTTTRCKCSNKPCTSPVINTDTCCTLAAQLCKSLSCGCYSALDLDQSTRGFTALYENDPYTLNRFALFGGCSNVVFACTSIAATWFLSSPQTVIQDFCPSGTTKNYIETVFPYPDTHVCINVLEYSRPNTDDPRGYFFAGTDNGLYVFSNGGEGFQLKNLSITNLSHGTWQKIDAFPNPIVDIKTTGLSLYIVSRTISNGRMVSKLSRIDFEDTVADMFNTTYTLAQSGIAPFTAAHAFTGIQPVAVSSEQGLPITITGEQLLLATNNGLFGSNATISIGNQGIANALSQDDSQWAHVPTNNTTMFEGIAGSDNPWPLTTWPISVEDLCGARTYEKSWIYQISGSNDNTTPYFATFVPSFFNAIVRNNAFENIDPITYFWTDGARRFFVINRQQDPATCNRLMSYPYNTIEWGVCAPGQNVLLFDPFIKSSKRFFWIKQIGATGILMAGTNNGVIALE